MLDRIEANHAARAARDSRADANDGRAATSTRRSETDNGEVEAASWMVELGSELGSEISGLCDAMGRSSLEPEGGCDDEESLPPPAFPTVSLEGERLSYFL